MDSNVIGATHFPGGFVGYSGYPMVSGDVGRHHHGRHHHGHHGHHPQAHGPMPQGFMMPPNPNQAGRDGHTMPAGQLLLSSGQRTLPAAFTAATAITPGAAWQCVAQIQRGYQATRLLVTATLDSAGTDVFPLVNVTGIDVGQRNQIVSPGVLVNSMFEPTAFDCRVILDPAGSGNFIVISGTSSTAITGEFTVKATAIGDASL